MPSGADTTHPPPLIIDLPGYEETATIEVLVSRQGAYGDAHGFVAVTPQVSAPSRTGTPGSVPPM